jgi:hypothetical protein
LCHARILNGSTPCHPDLRGEDFRMLVDAEPQIAAAMLPVIAGRLADLA